MRVIHLPSGRKGELVGVIGFDWAKVRWDSGWTSEVDRDSVRTLPDGDRV